MDYYYYADSEEPEFMRDGTEQHPYKYLRELSEIEISEMPRAVPKSNTRFKVENPG
jgi:hypothetical protein